MRIFVFSLFLCFNFFISKAQDQPSVNSNTEYIIVNGGGCTNCTIDRKKSSLEELILAIDEKYGKLNGFKVKIPGQPTMKINGSRTNLKYKLAIRKTQYGDEMQIFDLKTAKGKLKSNIIIKITK